MSCLYAFDEPPAALDARSQRRALPIVTTVAAEAALTA
jgi:energy-coupling factor transporter ATP-binding protein EcfA2